MTKDFIKSKFSSKFSLNQNSLQNCLLHHVYLNGTQPCNVLKHQDLHYCKMSFSLMTFQHIKKNQFILSSIICNNQSFLAQNCEIFFKFLPNSLRAPITLEKCHKLDTKRISIKDFYYIVISSGHLARKSDSTSIHYYEIRELKKTFKFNSSNPNQRWA